MGEFREWTNSPLRQGVNETEYYTLDTSPWPGTERASVTVKAYREDSAPVDVTSTVIMGSPYVSTTTINFMVTGLAASTTYKIIARWTNELGATEECWGEIVGET